MSGPFYQADCAVSPKMVVIIVINWLCNCIFFN